MLNFIKFSQILGIILYFFEAMFIFMLSHGIIDRYLLIDAILKKGKTCDTIRISPSSTLLLSIV